MSLHYRFINGFLFDHIVSLWPILNIFLSIQYLNYVMKVLRTNVGCLDGEVTLSLLTPKL